MVHKIEIAKHLLTGPDRDGRSCCLCASLCACIVVEVSVGAGVRQVVDAGRFRLCGASCSCRFDHAGRPGWQLQRECVQCFSVCVKEVNERVK